jgi:hypothetical protein
VNVTEIAEGTGIPSCWITYLLNKDLHCVDMWEVYRLAEYFNVTIDELIGRE